MSVALNSVVKTEEKMILELEIINSITFISPKICSVLLTTKLKKNSHIVSESYSQQIIYESFF